MNIGSTKLVKAIIKDLRRTGTKSKNLKGAACIVLIRVFLDFKFRVSAQCKRNTEMRYFTKSSQENLMPFIWSVSHRKIQDFQYRVNFKRNYTNTNMKCLMHPQPSRGNSVKTIECISVCFFYQLFGCPTTNLSHSINFGPECYRQACNVVGPSSPGKRLVRFESGTFRFDYNALTHQVTLPSDHGLLNFNLRNPVVHGFKVSFDKIF